ncbi:MAG: nucleotidyltransferase substrate binding protein [Candidatus Aureabacteria bacterium]|nr:nucleotidyltransferase substrate binding protein [Candidatus Auribacterota bacterium]
MKIFGQVELSALEQALDTLKEGLRHPVENSLERDGVLQRFEYTYELSWKIVRRCLLAMGRTDVSASPKPIWREALTEHFISDLEAWFGYVEARNLLSHVYNEMEAERIYNKVKQFPALVDDLIDNLKKRGLRNE